MTDDIRALTFDVFGTVVDWRSGVLGQARRVGERRGITVDWERVVDDWRGLYQPVMEEVRSGRRPWTKLDDLHREGLLALVEKHDIQGLTADDLNELVRAWHFLDPWPDVVDALKQMKQRYILATLSNGNVSLMVDMARYGGLPWDVILGAEVARHYKPRPEAYLAAARLLDLEPGQCMMVASHYHDLMAARACGLRTAYVVRTRQFGERNEYQGEPEVDLVVEDFEELAARLA